MNEKNCPSCGQYPNRSLSIDALIIKDHKLLLIKRACDPYKGFWALPGGHVDWDETVENAVKREVMEETNLKVTSLRLLGIYSKPERHPHQSVAVAYNTKTQGVPIAGDDAGELDFFPFDNLPQNLAFDHKEIIKDYLENTCKK